jgi:hypothetical protein
MIQQCLLLPLLLLCVAVNSVWFENSSFDQPYLPFFICDWRASFSAEPFAPLLASALPLFFLLATALSLATAITALTRACDFGPHTPTVQLPLVHSR